MDLSPKMTPIAESSQAPSPQTRINTGFQAWGQFPLWETRSGTRPSVLRHKKKSCNNTALMIH